MVANNSADLDTNLALYTRVAQASAAEVIRGYSTSFGWASKLLGRDVRIHVSNIYALVRVADEIVDGAAEQALGSDHLEDAGALLDELEADCYRAIDTGFSTNLVVHAFAHTARVAGFGRELVEPFFTSMRMDLHSQKYDQASFETYIYGSAEVVGLMCLQVYLLGQSFSAQQQADFVESARALGSAFQKVNFLRDLAADSKALGRSYFPDIDLNNFTEDDKARLVTDIDNELKVSSRGLVGLPKSSRRAVAAAQFLYEALNRELANTPASKLVTTRVRVNNAKKLLILLKATLGAIPK
ncbi:MAG: hypothetical protein RIR16_1004 [Actinomycetota bacterium]